MLNSSQDNLKVGSAEKRHFKTSFRRQTSFSKQTLNSDNKKSHLGQKNSTKISTFRRRAGSTRPHRRPEMFGSVRCCNDVVVVVVDDG